MLHSKTEMHYTTLNMALFANEFYQVYNECLIYQGRSCVFLPVNPYVLSAKQPPPREHLIAAALLATFFLIFVVIFGLILCRRKQMYGGFYLCTTPPLPDLIKSLDPTSPLIEQIHKLPYDPLWEYPRDNIVFGKYTFKAFKFCLE